MFATSMRAMRFWAIRQVLLLLLAGFVALGISNAAVASGAMGLNVVLAHTMPADMPSADCQPDLPDPCGGEMGTCVATCASPSVDLPQAVSVNRHLAMLRDEIALSSDVAAGLARPPSLPPPRANFI
jgi:hypothetical protein